MVGSVLALTLGMAVAGSQEGAPAASPQLLVPLMRWPDGATMSRLAVLGEGSAPVFRALLVDQLPSSPHFTAHHQSLRDGHSITADLTSYWFFYVGADGVPGAVMMVTPHPGEGYRRWTALEIAGPGYGDVVDPVVRQRLIEFLTVWLMPDEPDYRREHFDERPTRLSESAEAEVFPWPQGAARIGMPMLRDRRVVQRSRLSARHPLRRDLERFDQGTLPEPPQGELIKIPGRRGWHHPVSARKTLLRKATTAVSSKGLIRLGGFKGSFLSEDETLVEWDGSDDLPLPRRIVLQLILSLAGPHRWQVLWRYGDYRDVLGEETLGSSPDGPIEALLAAGLLLATEDFDDWIDANASEDGEETASVEAYRLLGETIPWLYPHDDFVEWAQDVDLLEPR